MEFKTKYPEFKTLKPMYAWIWKNRDHVSEVSGNPLLHEGHFKHHWQFAHVLGKGPYPSYKFNPDNIMLMLPEEHANQEQFEAFRERQQELKTQYVQESPYYYNN